MRITLFFASLLATSCLSPAAPTTTSVPQVKALGYGSVTSYPDYAEISVEASTTKDKLKDAVAEVQTVIDQVLKLSVTYARNSQDVRLSNVSANKEYTYVRNKRVFAGYNSTQSVTVKITDLSKLELYMEALLATRISSIKQISYGHTRADSLQREASVMALQDALRTVDKMCVTMHAKRGAVLEATNYKELDGAQDYHGWEEPQEIELYGKGFGGRGFKLTPELLRYSATTHIIAAVE